MWHIQNQSIADDWVWHIQNQSIADDWAWHIQNQSIADDWVWHIRTNPLQMTGRGISRTNQSSPWSWLKAVTRPACSKSWRLVSWRPGKSCCTCPRCWPQAAGWRAHLCAALLNKQASNVWRHVLTTSTTRQIKSNQIKDKYCVKTCCLLKQF